MSSMTRVEILRRPQHK